MPHHPWPVSSLQHRPTVLQQASQPTFSLVSPSSLLFTSPPSCHLGPVPASTAPSFHSIHQQAPLNSILQQAPLNSILQQAPLMCLTGPACTLNFIISILPLPDFRLPPPPACFLRAQEFISPPVFAVPGMLDVASVLTLFAAISTFVIPTLSWSSSECSLP
jgi:hypothetical protein